MILCWAELSSRWEPVGFSYSILSLPPSTFLLLSGSSCFVYFVVRSNKCRLYSCNVFSSLFYIQIRSQLLSRQFLLGSWYHLCIKKQSNFLEVTELQKRLVGSIIRERTAVCSGARCPNRRDLQQYHQDRWLTW